MVTIHQEDERIQNVIQRRPYIDIGMAILKRNGEEGTTLIQLKDNLMSRDCEIEIVLEPGSYIVVPRTTGCNV